MGTKKVINNKKNSKEKTMESGWKHLDVSGFIHLFIFNKKITEYRSCASL